MGRFGIPRNTLRDYIGICELRIIDSERYKRVVEAGRQRLGKVSVKSIELRRRAVLNECRVQSNRLNEAFLSEGRLLQPKVSSSRNLYVLGVRFAGRLFTEGALLIGSNS